MLVLSRKEHESIVIGDDWVVEVVEINESKGIVKLGFSIPGEIPVHRHELWVALQAEGKRYTDPHAIRLQANQEGTSEGSPPTAV